MPIQVIPEKLVSPSQYLHSMLITEQTKVGDDGEKKNIESEK